MNFKKGSVYLLKRQNNWFKGEFLKSIKRKNEIYLKFKIIESSDSKEFTRCDTIEIKQLWKIEEI